jgi:hypothetical protein
LLPLLPRLESRNDRFTRLLPAVFNPGRDLFGQPIPHRGGSAINLEVLFVLSDIRLSIHGFVLVEDGCGTTRSY